MEHDAYHKLQGDLGAVGDRFISNVRSILNKSTTDEETKQLIAQVCKEIRQSINELAILVSKVAESTVS